MSNRKPDDWSLVVLNQPADRPLRQRKVGASNLTTSWNPKYGNRRASYKRNSLRDVPQNALAGPAPTIGMYCVRLIESDIHATENDTTKQPTSFSTDTHKKLQMELPCSSYHRSFSDPFCYGDFVCTSSIRSLMPLFER
jgi:hypothetical protein